MSVLTVEHVTKRFGQLKAVDDISLQVEPGEIVGFVGPNGAGKTTLIKMILGLIEPDLGAIAIHGRDVRREFEEAMVGVAGIVETPDMYKYLTGRDNLRLVARVCDATEQDVDQVLQTVGMASHANEKFSTYSLGMKQRLGVAQALLHKPQLMILDEPTNGLDPAGIKAFRDLIVWQARTYQTAVLVCSHHLEEIAQMCDRVCFVRKGRLQSDARMQELLTNSEHRVRYTLTPADRAESVVREHLSNRLLSVAPGGVFELQLEQQELNTVTSRLIEAGLGVVGIAPVEASLEQRYLSIMEGGNTVE